MGNKQRRRKLAGYQAVLAQHHEKIAAELKNLEPDYGLIEHWKAEVKGLEKTVARILRRPGGSA